MATLVIGCGMVGAHIAAELVRNGMEDAYLLGVRPDLEYIRRVADIPQSHVINQSVTNGEVLAEIFQRYDIDKVVMAAGSLSPAFSKNPGAAILNESRLILSLCSACMKWPIKKLVYISSFGVYGVGKQREEEIVPAPCSAYGITKFYNEQVLDFLVEQTSLQTVVVRAPGILGPNPAGSGNWMSSSLKRVFESDEPIIQLPERFNRAAEFLDVRDLSRFIPVAFEQQDRYDIVNLGTGKLTTAEEFAQGLEYVLGKTVRMESSGNQEQMILPAMQIDKVINKYNFCKKYDIIDSLVYIGDFYV